MSGHSKWSTIKHGKAVTDARRGKLFTKLTKEVIIAVRESGPNPETNFRLRLAMQKAKDSNMPSTNVERAIKRANGDDSDGARMEEVTYEGYGPGGTAILLQALTDNRNRTVSDVRSTFTKLGGNLAEAGAVSWQFEQKGLIVVESNGDSEDLTLVAIEAGADDFETIDTSLHAYSLPGELENLRKALTDYGAEVTSTELTMLPINTVPLDDKTAKKALNLLDQLEELDDTQKVYSNADFTDEVLTTYGNES
tara:strand:+ start:42654 stop:43409 length:756 start_codon:yes stop_codon:yes gene_type:complete